MSCRDRQRLLNRAVRDYCPGGNETLDAVELMHKISDRHSEHTEAGKISRLAETKLNDIANAMREQAREWQKEESNREAPTQQTGNLAK